MGPEEFIALWDLTIDKMVRFHDNISMEIAEMIKTIQKTMNTDGNALVPACEARAAFGKVSSHRFKNYFNCINSMVKLILGPQIYRH